MKIKHILVVYKKSSYQMYAKERKNKQFLQLMRSGHHATKRFLSSHAIHAQALVQVRKILKKRGVSARFVYRAQAFKESKADLILTLGGDGTFLEASHRIKDCPILGLNSNPNQSIGMFCGSTVDTLHQILDGIEQGSVRCLELARLQLVLGKKEISMPVLNELLVAHRCPAATSRCIVQWKNEQVEHKSSGIWISSAAGSTAAIKGAGGQILPICSRKFQFIVREPYQPPWGKKLTLTSGVLHENEQFIVYSNMRSGRIFVDGSHRSFPFTVGEKVVITSTAPCLKIYNFQEHRRESLKK